MAFTQILLNEAFYGYASINTHNGLYNQILYNIKGLSWHHAMVKLVWPLPIV